MELSASTGLEKWDFASNSAPTTLLISTPCVCAVRGHVAYADVAPQVRCRVARIHHYDNCTHSPFRVLPSLLAGVSAIAWSDAGWR